MADLIDVQNALVALAAATLYPTAPVTNNQASVAGPPVRIYAGWPNASQLDADLALNPAICHLSIYSQNIERNTTRYPQDWQQASINTASLTLTANGQQITLAGTIPAANNPHVLSALVNGLPYVYAVQVTDTLATAAAALAALIAAGVPGTTAAAGVITVAAGGRIGPLQVGITGTNLREIRRQERSFQITVWADTQAHRDAIVALVDVAMAALRFITLADGTAGRLIYRNSLPTDQMQKERLFRRDLVYSVEYGTTQTETDSQITQTQLNDSVQIDGATAAVSLAPVYQ